LLSAQAWGLGRPRPSRRRERRQLPGNRDLAEKYDVALGTLQKALRVLQDERWLIATPSVGVFVAEQPTGPTAGSDVAAQLHDLQAVVANLVERV
jgi:GntR family transcriptional regulator